ncbi:hypothetical protein AA0473_0799 [Acetobacter orleanensis NRIC 0473]|nr:hypothetical protein AA0473_0799 [Acetobacter orleanensis NRIC 0473]
MLGVEARERVNGLHAIHCIGPVAAVHMAVNKARQNIPVWHRIMGRNSMDLVRERQATGHNPVRKNKMSVKIWHG